MESSSKPGEFGSSTPRAILLTESAGEYDEIFAAFMKDMKPGNIVERALVGDVFDITWEINRYRRIKTTLLNDSFRATYAEILEAQIDAETMTERSEAAKAAVRRRFESDEGRTEVFDMLAKCGLSESSVEVSAIEATAEVIGAIDRTLAALELRRINAVRFLAEYRDGLASRAEQVLSQIIENALPQAGCRAVNQTGLKMATERQILANRRNAANSTGPRSKAGKGRASHNSTRHGLSRSAVFDASDRDWIERFALEAARGDQSVLALELARSAAGFHLDLARIRKVRVKVTEELKTNIEKRKFKRLAEFSENLVRLNRIDRYERRAAARRDKALRAIITMNKSR